VASLATPQEAGAAGGGHGAVDRTPPSQGSSVPKRDCADNAAMRMLQGAGSACCGRGAQAAAYHGAVSKLSEGSQ